MTLTVLKYLNRKSTIDTCPVDVIYIYINSPFHNIAFKNQIILSLLSFTRNLAISSSVSHQSSHFVWVNLHTFVCWRESSSPHKENTQVILFSIQNSTVGLVLQWSSFEGKNCFCMELQPPHVCLAPKSQMWSWRNQTA